MLDVNFPSAQSDAETLPTDLVPRDSVLAFDATDTLDPSDDSVLIAEPDGDVFANDDADDDDDEEDDVDDDDTELADELDDDDD